MSRRSIIGLAILAAGLFLATWGNWSHYALGRGWTTGLAFGFGVVCLTILGAWLVGGAVERRTVQEPERSAKPDAED